MLEITRHVAVDLAEADCFRPEPDAPSGELRLSRDKDVMVVFRIGTGAFTVDAAGEVALVDGAAGASARELWIRGVE